MFLTQTKKGKITQVSVTTVGKLRCKLPFRMQISLIYTLVQQAKKK